MNLENNENHYMKAYENHYRTEGELTKRSVESMLTNFIHLQEVMSKNIDDIADILFVALRATDSGSHSHENRNGFDMPRTQNSLGYEPVHSGMNIERNTSSVEKINRVSQERPQNSLADNSLIYNEVLIVSDNDRKALKAGSNIHVSSQREALVSTYESSRVTKAPIVNSQDAIRNLIVSNQIKNRNLITEATKPTNTNIDRAHPQNRSESDIQIVEGHPTDFNFKPDSKTKNINNPYSNHNDSSDRGNLHQPPKSIRSEKHLDLIQNQPFGSNENLANTRPHIEPNPILPTKDQFEQYLFNKDRVVFHGKSFVSNHASDNQSSKSQVGLRKLKNPSGPFASDEQNCVGCLFVG
jgi:hypothetical protein